MATYKGFLSWAGQNVLPITRGELVLDQDGNVALTSEHFLAGLTHEDGSINQYGLITAAERAMLSGGGAGGINDIYTKLDYINKGLTVNGTSVSFYNDSGATPITLATSNLSIGIANNIITIGLANIAAATTLDSVNQLIKTITIDEYGRVTSVTGGVLTNAEIPSELSDKTIKNSALDTCTTSDPTSDSSVVNKKYVDTAIRTVTNIATGALVFKGPIDSSSELQTIIDNKNNSAFFNSYYKIAAAGLTISKSHVTGAIQDVTLDVGDTIIVYPEGNVGSIVVIPSGDDITRIRILDNNNTQVMAPTMGDVTFKFSKVFELLNPGSGTINVSLLQADSTTDGYLSKEDYRNFKAAYDSASTLSYSQTAIEGLNSYEIGKLTIGSTTTTIYGLNDKYTFSLNNGSNNDAYNPIFKISANGLDLSSFTFSGLNGIIVKKNNNNIEITSNNVVKSDSSEYLTITGGNQFGVKIGHIDEDSGEVVNGLTDYSEFKDFTLNVVASMLTPILITNSLTDNNGTNYYYGSNKMIEALTVTI